MSGRTSRRLNVHMPSTKPKRRMGSASPQMRKKGQRNNSKRRHHGAIIVDNGAKIKQRVRRDSQNSTESREVEIHRKEWEAYKCEVNNLTSWLTAATEKSSRWMAPTNNILSIRVFLERHLASAMELETHQHQKDTVLMKGLDLAGQYPQLASEMETTMTAIEAQWNQLVQRLEKQFLEIEDALEGAKVNIRKGRNGGEPCLNQEQTKDTLDHMALRLRSRKRRNSPMEINVKALNRQVGSFGTSSRLSTSRQQPSMTSTLSSTLGSTLSSTLSSDSSYSASPDFDALYNELSDWLKEMQIVVSDSSDLCVSETRIEHICKGYEQELQMREVSRSKLERKAHKLMASNPNQANEVANKLESINQHWKALQERLNPQTTHISNGGTKQDAFENSEEALSTVVEVEDIIVKLKAWLIGMERKLFAADSITCPGTVKEMEKRLVDHKELQTDINKHAEGIKVVLTMCDILQRDKYACASDKESEALQLAAINLERRWEAIQAQARDLQCGLELKLRTFKGPEALASTPDTKPTEPETDVEQGIEADEDNSVIFTLNSPTKSLAAAEKLFRPSAAKDDDAVDGYTCRMQDWASDIDYDDFLIVREAFSENDAFSMSETSDVSLGDLDFDDVLLMKRVSDEELGACASPPSECDTPEILAMSDDMLDAYLKMEEEILLQEELMDEPIGTPIQRRRNPSSASDVEFWSVSPRDDPMLSSLEFSTGEIDAEDLELGPMLLHAGEQGYSSSRMSHRGSFGMAANYHPLSSSLPEDGRGFLPEIINAGQSSAPASFQPWMSGNYTPGPIDFMSTAAQDALDSHGSSDEEEEKDYGGDAEDNDEDIWDEPEHDVTITQDVTDEPEVFAFEDDFKTPTKGGLYSSDDDCQVPTKDVNKRQDRFHAPLSTPSLSFKPERPSYFPPFITSSSAPLDWSNVPVNNDITTPMIVKPGGKSCGFFKSLLDEDDFMAVQEALSDDAEKEGMQLQQEDKAKSQLLELRKSLNSSLGSTVSRKNLMPEFLSPASKYQKDDLLEITDLSLSHMCESLDFMTELAHWIMPVHQDNDPPVKDTSVPPRKDTSEPKTSQPNQSQGLSDTSYQYRPFRRSSGTHSPSLSFEDLFEDIPESTKPDKAEHCASSEHKDTSDTESSQSLSSHESDEKPTRDTAVPYRVQHELSSDDSIPPQIHEVQCNTSIGSIDLPEFTAQPDHEDLEVFSNPGSSTPSHSDIPEGSPRESPIHVTTEPFSSETETPSPDGEDEGEEDTQAYFTYVSELAEACSEGELSKYFGQFHQQKCHVWSLGLSDTLGYPALTEEEEKKMEEVIDLEKEIANAEMSADSLDSDCEPVDDALETTSQCSDDTDKLMEASDELVKELQDRRRLQMDPLPESEIGSWRDVIVLWLKDNEESEKAGVEATIHSEEASIEEVAQTDVPDDCRQEDQTAEGAHPVQTKDQSCDITDSGVWMDSPSPSMAATSTVPPADSDITEEADSGRFSEPSEEGSPIRHISPQHSPRLETLKEDLESLAAAADDDEVVPQEKERQEVVEPTIIKATEDQAVMAAPNKSRSFFSRVIRAALPIQVLMILYIVAVILLPSVVVNGDGECTMSMTDRLMFDGHTWVPTVRYTRGPPPM